MDNPFSTFIGSPLPIYDLIKHFSRHLAMDRMRPLHPQPSFFKSVLTLLAYFFRITFPYNYFLDLEANYTQSRDYLGKKWYFCNTKSSHQEHEILKKNFTLIKRNYFNELIWLCQVLVVAHRIFSCIIGTLLVMTWEV